MTETSVELVILGFAYKVACREDEVAHVKALGEKITAKMSDLSLSFPGQSPARLFLLLSLELMDALEKSGQKLPKTKPQQTAKSEDKPASASSDEVSTAQANDAVLEATQLYLAQVFDQVATRLDGLQKELLSVEGRLPKSD